jgi:hypothetical protein
MKAKRNPEMKKDSDLIDLMGNDEKMIVDISKKISVRFDYPLSRPVWMEFTGKNPWRLSDLIDAIGEGYEKIYDEEDETRTKDTISRGTLVNRPETDGKHGIWGHVLNDLYIERAYSRNGKWYLYIGS